MSSPQDLQKQLSKLSLQQKQELLQSLKTKELLTKEQVLETATFHGGQRDFLFSQKKITAAFSGNGWGKTTMLVIRLILAHHPELWDSFKPLFPAGFKAPRDPIGHSWFFLPGFDKVEDYWNELKRWCPPSKLPKTNKMGTSAIKRLEWTNNTFTTYYSHDQDSSKAEGTNIDALFCDEPPPRSLWIAAYRGLRNNKNYFIILAGTPISEAWLYEEIFRPWADKTDPNILVIQGSTRDNPHLSAEWIADFESRLTDDEKRVRLHGEFASLQGRVFKEFNRRTHVHPFQEWPRDWPVYMAIDPHPRKPHTAIYVGVTNDDVLVVLDELSVEGDVEELAKAIKAKEKEAGYRIISRRIDNSGSGTDWNRDSFIDQLARQGVRTNPMRKVEKDVASSIQKIKMLLKNKQLMFLENCPLMISDMELYAWQDYRHPESSGVQEKPRKINDDMIDPLRYIVVSNPIHNPTMNVISTAPTGGAYSKRVPKPGPSTLL